MTFETATGVLTCNGFHAGPATSWSTRGEAAAATLVIGGDVVKGFQPNRQRGEPLLTQAA